MPHGHDDLRGNDSPPAASVARIHSVAVQTRNFEDAYKFYTTVVGLPVVREPFRYKTRLLAWLQAGPVLLELYSVKEGVEPVAYDTNRVGPDHIAFEVADLDGYVTHLAANDVRIVKGPLTPPSGDPHQPRVLFVEGPDGDEIQFREPHPWAGP
jgi:catechol 2,3-dioxygenase-like lactoylglutathione lyase family enzyme